MYPPWSDELNSDLNLRAPGRRIRAQRVHDEKKRSACRRVVAKLIHELLIDILAGMGEARRGLVAISGRNQSECVGFRPEVLPNTAIVDGKQSTRELDAKVHGMKIRTRPGVLGNQFRKRLPLSIGVLERTCAGH